MKKSVQTPRLMGLLVGSAALGALAMFVFDPSKGRRRRALLRDKTRRSLTHAARMLRVSARDLGHRAHGFGATARRLFARNRATDDLVLIERVRAKMGRIVSHPHAIQIGARAGRVTLSGPILPGEAEPLLAAVRSVWGVASVEDHLVVYDRPDSIPSLQGGMPRNAVRAGAARHEWRPAWRVAAVLAGGALALCAIPASGALRAALALAGAGLATRGAANVPLSRLARPTRRRPHANGDRQHAPAPLAEQLQSAAESVATSTALH